ncbi:MAG: hypothetical protein COW01_09100 [Bdellovibrionales bacterium CG12_big_fil_rev_8_21_14_0_65_38_15]|nr:MAG: hypothetical protein COW01_09100 [Bdellovibrionales bacterium CG12_big_fil_rev_8_21_14_0_65_38_15]
MDKVKEKHPIALGKLLDKARSLPTSAGCYLMKNHLGDILYVGKAKQLKPRVTSYFNASTKSPKTEILVSKIFDFEFIVTGNEAEALVLENNLIKKHSPKYNIRLKDDKSYPYIIVDTKEPFPRLVYARKFKRRSGLEVYGPFPTGTNIGEVLRLLNKSFTLRDCTLREFNSRKEPCLLYQIHQCSAPCVSKIRDEEYKKDLKLALAFLSGNANKSLKSIESKMLKAAEDEKFELAAILRDHLEVLTTFNDSDQQKNAELKGKDKDVDVVAYHQGDVEVDIAIYMIRNGLLLGHKNFNFPVVDMSDDIASETLQFLFHYYSESNDTLPSLVVAPFDNEGRELLSQAFSLQDKKINVDHPNKKFSSMWQLAYDQSVEHQRVRINNQESVFVGLNKLKELLSLKERPVTLECYDIAIFQGSSPTAARITFHDGKADKKNYRHYHLKELPEGNNDFAMMGEVVQRRLKDGDLPDVFVIDGGMGQVNIWRAVLAENNIEVPVVGIAKAKSAKGTEERLVIPNRTNPYLLHKNLSLFRILVQMRDEAHRFSRRLHHKQESKRTFSSWIDEISGIGPKTKKTILTNIKISKDELSELSEDRIALELGVDKKIARKIRAYFDSISD